MGYPSLDWTTPPPGPFVRLELLPPPFPLPVPTINSTDMTSVVLDQIACGPRDHSKLTLSTVAKAPFWTACPAGYDGCAGDPSLTACKVGRGDKTRSNSVAHLNGAVLQASTPCLLAPLLGRRRTDAFKDR